MHSSAVSYVSGEVILLKIRYLVRIRRQEHHNNRVPAVRVEAFALQGVEPGVVGALVDPLE